ncbi:hypothetical protein STEG23_010711, partial [Scotinomys teguina]
HRFSSFVRKPELYVNIWTLIWEEEKGKGLQFITRKTQYNSNNDKSYTNIDAILMTGMLCLGTGLAICLPDMMKYLTNVTGEMAQQLRVLAALPWNPKEGFPIMILMYLLIESFFSLFDWTLGALPDV